MGTISGSSKAGGRGNGWSRRKETHRSGGRVMLPWCQALRLLTAALLLKSAIGVQRTRLPRKVQQQQQQDVDPFANLEPYQPTTQWQENQGASNDTLLVILWEFGLRLTGAAMVPFPLEHQQAMIQAVRDTLFWYGYATMTSYKETYPDLSAPEHMRELEPSVEVSFQLVWVINRTADGTVPVGTSQEVEGVMMYGVYVQMCLAIIERGQWPGVRLPTLTYTMARKGYRSGGYKLHPIIPLELELEVTFDRALAPGKPPLYWLEVMKQSVDEAVLGDIGTLVQVVRHTSARVAQGTGSLTLEVTLFMCRNSASIATPECEKQLLAAAFNQLAQSDGAQQLWRTAGITGIKLVDIRPREAPPPPTSNSNSIGSSSSSSMNSNDNSSSNNNSSWVPWHLDRIDQRELPLDGKYTPTADGSGVNVYILSSGTRADHEELKFLDGTPGSRVQAAFGSDGLDPLQDCPDDSIWFGYGTYVASLCCGLQLGPAKNATVQSVRYRRTCFEDPTIFDSGQLPPAMDLVLSTIVKPAVVLIDTWWALGRTTVANIDVDQVYGAIKSRLDRFQEQDITVVASAGPESSLLEAPCSNVFSSHPGVISVAASDTADQVTDIGPFNSSCITLWAPSGGFGSGLLGAWSVGPRNYTRIVDRAFGSAAVVAGVAAQYLQLHPNATSQEVRDALVQMATPDIVAGVGTASTTAALLFTNLSRPGGEETMSSSILSPVASASSSNSNNGSGGGLNYGAIAGIAVAGVLVFAGLLAAALVVRHRRSTRPEGQVSSKASNGAAPSDWEIHSCTIEILKREDGSEWLLGEGRFSKTYKAVKGGLQIVAVKQMKATGLSGDLFGKEAALMKFASRDANIVQFYGACLEGDTMMLVVEYMQGGDLCSALAQDDSGVLRWDSRGKEVMLDAVRGCCFLHSNHVTHGSISSKNVLLGRDGRAKLGDVGLAHIFGEQASGNETHFGQSAWAAPEALLPQGSCTEKSDIWGLGVVLWELVTRGAPHPGQIRDVKVPEECPQGVADAIAACLQRNPALRPTARQFYSLLLACPPNGPYAAAPSRSSVNSASAARSIGSGGRPVTFTSAITPPVLPGSTISGSLVQPASRARSGTSAISVSDSGVLVSPDQCVPTIPFHKVQLCTNPDGSLVRLGSGTCGAVYKVALEGIEQLAAKVVPLGHCSAGGETLHPTGTVMNHLQVGEFIREASILWKLRHPNIVGLSGVTIDGTKGYLLMELMDESLYKVLNAKAERSGDRILSWYNRGKKILLDVAVGLHYLHSLHVTHFDLKSANILLAKDFSAAKIADVGLARVMSRTHHSLSEGVLGTFAYMAPELMCSTKCDQAVDVFSFGVLLWEVCTGTRPVRGSLSELEVPAECPLEVAQLFQQCTTTDPAARPTARKLVERLRALQQEQPTPPEQPGGALASAGTAAAEQPPQPPAMPARGFRVNAGEPLVSPFQILPCSFEGFNIQGPSRFGAQPACPWEVQ